MRDHLLADKLDRVDANEYMFELTSEDKILLVANCSDEAYDDISANKKNHSFYD